MRFQYLDNPRFAAAQSEFESACHASRAYDARLAEALRDHGDHGPAVSGAGRDHFPAETKEHLRRIAQAVAYHSDRGHALRPKYARSAAMRRLAQEVATRDGSGFYGPQPLSPELSTYEATGRLQRKIDIFYAQGRVNGRLQWVYACSTNWHARCRDAAQYWANIHTQGDVTHVKARFA